MSPLKINEIKLATIENKNIFIVDNFLETPEKYRDLALQSENLYNYPTPGIEHWLGFRCDIRKHFHKNELIDELYKKIIKIVFPKFKLNSNTTEYEWFFHYGPRFCQDFLGNFFHQYSLHKDERAICAGVIYLNPNPLPETGTCFSDGKEVYVVENIYNRMIFYDSSILHGVENLFGETINNSRLVITFFFWHKSTLDINRVYNDRKFTKFI